MNFKSFSYGAVVGGGAGARIWSVNICMHVKLWMRNAPYIYVLGEKQNASEALGQSSRMTMNMVKSKIVNKN